MTELLGIVGSVTKPSKTRAAVEVALEGAEQATGAQTDVLHLAELDLETADGRTLEAYEGDTRHVLEQVIDSEAYLFGTPVYRASYSGALKNLLDLIPRGQWQADVAPLEASAVGLIATGGSDHHFLSVDEELRPVLSFFGAHTVGSGAYLDPSAFEDGAVVDEEARQRLETLGAATVELSRTIRKSEHLAAIGPQV